MAHKADDDDSFNEESTTEEGDDDDDPPDEENRNRDVFFVDGNGQHVDNHDEVNIVPMNHLSDHVNNIDNHNMTQISRATRNPTINSVANNGERHQELQVFLQGNPQFAYLLQATHGQFHRCQVYLWNADDNTYELRGVQVNIQEISLEQQANHDELRARISILQEFMIIVEAMRDNESLFIVTQARDNNDDDNNNEAANE